MKKLTIIIKDEFLFNIMGAVVKTGADFTVETVGEAEPEPAPVRHIQKRTADGRSLREFILDEAIARQDTSVEELGLAAKAVGFNYQSGRNVARTLAQEGLLKQRGQRLVPAPGVKPADAIAS